MFQKYVKSIRLRPNSVFKFSISMFQKYVKSIRLRPTEETTQVTEVFQKNVKLIGLRPKIQKIFYSTYKSIRRFSGRFFSVKIFEFTIYYG